MPDPAVPATAVLERLRAVRGFVLDMDGTLVLGDKNNQGRTPLPGALDFVTTLDDLGLPFCILTNGTTRTSEQYADSLRAVGFPVTADRMLTPASAAVEVFLERGYRRVMVLCGKGITEPLEAAGIETLPPIRGAASDAVMAAWFRQELTFEALEAAVFAVFNGADFCSASQSLFFATADGKSLGTPRAISAVVRDVTGAPGAVPPRRAGQPAGGSAAPPGAFRGTTARSANRCARCYWTTALRPPPPAPRRRSRRSPATWPASAGS